MFLRESMNDTLCTFQRQHYMMSLLLSQISEGGSDAPHVLIPPSLIRRRQATDQMRRLLNKRQGKQRCPPPLPKDVQIEVLQNLLIRLHRWQLFSLTEFCNAKKQRAAAHHAFRTSIRVVASTMRSLEIVQRELDAANSALAQLRAT